MTSSNCKLEINGNTNLFVPYCVQLPHLVDVGGVTGHDTIIIAFQFGENQLHFELKCW